MSESLPSLTQPCEDRDFLQWHRGCPWCAVWVVRLDGPAVDAVVHAARAVVAPWLLPHYARQPHVTLAYRGLMAGATPHPQAEFSGQDLGADIRRLQSAGIEPFALQLQGADSFATVPYLAVAQAGPLHRLHAVMTGHTPYPGWHYVPHVTLGHYGCQMPMAPLVASLQNHVGPDVLWAGEVQALWLARYRSADIAGPLYWEGCFDLHQQCYQPAPGALLGTGGLGAV